jgi:dTDP-4-dehydrorhamnose 3,5-epimerase
MIRTHEISFTPVLGLRVFRPFVFRDFRGEYTETYNQKDVSPEITFVQDSAIRSTQGVLRGYHGDARTHKLITCLAGAFQIAFICIDPQDDRFMQCETMVLDAHEHLSVLLPPKFVNAHQCLTAECLFFYKQNTFYKGQRYQYTIKWDSVFPGWWMKPVILSERDTLQGRGVLEYINLDENVLREPEEVNQ